MSKERGICLALKSLDAKQGKCGLAVYEQAEAEIRDLNGYKYWILKTGSKYCVYDFATGMIVVAARKTVSECVKYVEQVLPKIQATFKSSFYRNVLYLANEYRLEHDIPTYEL